MGLARRDVCLALVARAGPARSDMVPMSDGAPGRSVVSASERPARREARVARATLLDSRRHRGRRLPRRFGRPGCCRGRRGCRRRCRCGRWRRSFGARGPAARDAGRVRRAAGGFRRDGSVVRAARGRGSRTGRRRLVGCRRAMSLVRACSRRGYDHLLRRRRRAEARAGGCDPRQWHLPGVRQQSRRGNAQEERDERQSHSTSGHPDCATCTAFVGRQRPGSPFPTDFPDLAHEYKKVRRTASRWRSRLPLFARDSSNFGLSRRGSARRTERVITRPLHSDEGGEVRRL